jgi:hypothetical protein
MEKANIGTLEIEELACYLTGLDYDEIDADTATIEDALIDKFGIDIDQFTELMKLLLPTIDIGESPLTGKLLKGFASREKQMWFVKIEA